MSSVIAGSLGVCQVHHNVQRAADGDTAQHNGGQGAGHSTAVVMTRAERVVQTATLTHSIAGENRQDECAVGGSGNGTGWHICSD